MAEKNNYFNVLNAINVNDMTEKKNGLTYLSWGHAWKEVKRIYPYSYYTIYENADGWNYFTDGNTCWVKTGVTIVDGEMELEHIEYLPIMDFRNKSIALDMVTSFDVNKAIQRSLTKAIARHGLGLYVYAGEDLPFDKEEGEADMKERLEKKANEALIKKAEKEPIDDIKANALLKRCATDNVDSAKMLALYKVEDVKALTMKAYDNINRNWDKIKDSCGV